ncbi:MAG: hypothetical protein ACUVSX_04155 [Aggregatilineales bacterium]
MAGWARILTVDPAGEVGRMVRAALDLLESPATLVEVPIGSEALDEIKHRPCSLLLAAHELDDSLNGAQLSVQARKLIPKAGIVLLIEADTPGVDEDALAQAGVICLRRPVDAHQFMRVLAAGLDGGDLFAALRPPAGSGEGPMLPDLGPVPAIDNAAARTILDALLTDVGAMAVVLASRAGEVLLERGAVGYLDRERLARALLPIVATSFDMSGLVGGRASSVQFYDGENYDVFVLSVGLHHFLCLVFDGQAGNRQFGAVNRFGRRAAEDLVALLGAAAYTVHKPAAERDDARLRRAKRITQTAPSLPSDDSLQPIARAAEVAVPAPAPFKLEPVEQFDPSIFDQLDTLNLEAADALFDPEALGELLSKSRDKGGPIGFAEAVELGIMPDLDAKA